MDSDGIPTAVVAGEDFHLQWILRADGRGASEEECGSDESEFSSAVHRVGARGTSGAKTNFLGPRCRRAQNPAIPNLVRERGGGCGAVKAEPGLGGLQALIHVLDVLHALIIQPVFEGSGTLLGIHRNAFLPRCTAAEDTGEIRA